MALAPDTESIFGPDSVFGRAVAKISRRGPRTPQKDKAPLAVETEQQFRSELDAIASQTASQTADAYKGHHIVHGVSGAGKTVRLLHHVQRLAAKRTAENTAPILVLCYNEPLAVWLQSQFARRGLARHVIARHFHRWCREQLMAFHLPPPPKEMPPSAQIKDLVQRVIHALSTGAIPAGQYAAVLVDEAHDFEAPWLSMLAQLPASPDNHLVLYYDDAQSLLKRKRTERIRFDQHGIRTDSIQRLTVNRRNTEPAFNAIMRMAGALVEPIEADANGIPRLQPQSSGRAGPAVLFFPMSNLREQGRKAVELLQQAHSLEGIPWRKMAVLCDNRFQMDVCDGALRYQRVPRQLRRGAGDYDPYSDTVKIMSLQACAGLEFEVVVIVDSGEPPSSELEIEEKQRQLYIAATRARNKLYVIGIGKPCVEPAPQPDEAD